MENKVKGVQDFLLESGRGKVHHMAELRTKLELPGGRKGVAWLCAIKNTLWIAARSESLGKAISVPMDKIGIVKNFWGSVLKVGEQPYPIPLTGFSAIREVIAAARLYNPSQPEITEEELQGPFIARPSFQEERWLMANLHQDEQLIAFLQSATTAEIHQNIAGASIAEYRFLLTDQRCGLLAVSDLGDHQFLPLIHQSPQIEKGFGRATILCGPQEWKSTLGNIDSYEKMGELIPLERAQRLRKAGMMFRKLETPVAEAQSKRLFGALHNEADPLNRLIAAWMVEGHDISAPLSLLMRSTDDSQELAAWITEAELNAQEIGVLLQLCYQRANTAKEAKWSLPLHVRKREILLQLERDPLKLAGASLEYVEHLLFSEEPQQAQQVLEDLLTNLPPEELQSALPPLHADLTQGQGAPSFQLRALLLLARAKGSAENLDSETLAALTRCQPLYAKRAKALSKCQDQTRKRQGLLIHQILTAKGLQRQESTPNEPKRTLDEKELDLLHHPVARSNGSLGAIQSWLADIDPPDHGLLRAYCEQLDSIKHPTAFGAFRDGCKLLGLENIQAYISRGERNVGIRSHEIPQNFLVIGSQHIETNTPFSLNRSEMYALTGMELAHLRFGHSRITSNELWVGMFNKGSTALGTIASLLPLLKHLPTSWIGKEKAYQTARAIIPMSWLKSIYEVDDEGTLAAVVGQNIGKIGEKGGEVAGTANSIWDVASNWLQPSNAQEEQNLNVDPSQIIAAHRAMQLSADRAALLLSGDLASTIRSFFLSHSSLLAELKEAEEHGLNHILQTQQDEQDDIRKDLAVRCAALIAFYLSTEYQQFIRACS